MAINLEKMAQDRANAQKGADDFKMPVGDTALYIAPPARPDDDLPYIEVLMHWGLGKNNQMVMCQDAANNELMRNPHLVEMAKKRGIATGTVKVGKDTKECIAGGCAVCKKLDEGGLSERQKAKRAWLWMISPILARADARKPFAPWPDGVTLVPYLSSFTVWTGIVDQFAACGDITNPEAASYVRVIREGKGATDTKYNVQPHLETVKQPVAISKQLAALIASDMAPGEKCDPYTHLASKLRNEDEVNEMINGTKSGEEYEEEAASPEGSAETGAGSHSPPSAGKPKVAASKPAPAAAPASTGKPAQQAPAKPAASKPVPKPATKPAPKVEDPACFGLDPDPGTEDCKKCPSMAACFAKCGVELPGEGESESAEDVPAASEQPAADEEIVVAVTDCVKDAEYQLVGANDGVKVTYKGVGKGKHMFMQVGGTALFKLEPGDHVKQLVTPEEASGPSEDVPGDSTDDSAADELAKLERELANSSKGKPAAKPAAKK